MSRRRASRGTAPGPRRGRGLALIVVLWAAALMTLLAASFSFSLRTEARLAAGVIDRAAAGAAAEAGVQRLMASVVAAERRVPRATRGHIVLDGIDVELTMRPENARVDLNAAPPKLIEGLMALALAETGAEGSTDALTDAVLDWRDADSRARPRGAEASDYEAAGVAARPRNGAFLSVAELSQLAGMTAPLFEFLAPLVTVYAWSPQVDAMSASRTVLRAVPGLSEAEVDAFLAAREEDPDGLGSLALLAGGGRYLARSGGTVFSLVASARTPSGVRAVRRAVVKLNANAARPMAVLAWFEEAAADAPGAHAEDADAAGSGDGRGAHTPSAAAPGG